MAKAKSKEPLQPSGERHDYYSLCLSPDNVLEEVMRFGAPPSMEELSGWEFRGYNTLDLAAIAGFRKFKKGFYREDPSRDFALGINGYNVKVAQNNLGEPWIDKFKRGESVKHGWYDVYPVRLTELDNKYPNSLLINYGISSKNAVYDPARLMRDYIVQVYPDNPDLLLGKAFGSLGTLRIFVSYFVLERHNQSVLPR